LTTTLPNNPCLKISLEARMLTPFFAGEIMGERLEEMRARLFQNTI